MLNHARSIASCFVALSCIIVACGADDDTDDIGTGGSAGKGGTGGSAGKGGASGKAGKGGSAGSSSAGKGGTGGSTGGTGGSTGGTGGSTGGTGGSTGGTAGGTAGSSVGGEGGSDSLGGQGGEAGEASAGAPSSAGEGGMGGESGSASAGTAGTGMAGTAGTGTAGTAGAGGVAGTAGVGGATAGGAGTAGTGGAPIVPDTIDNPGFEQGSNNVLPTNWIGVGDTAASTYSWSDNGGAHSGPGFLDLWLGSAYTVDVSQVVTPLPDGSYSLSIWHYGGAYTEQYVYVTGYNESDPTDVMSQATVASPNGTTFVEIVIDNIPVTSGEIKIGIHSVGASGNWSHFDDVTLTLDD